MSVIRYATAQNIYLCRYDCGREEYRYSGRLIMREHDHLDCTHYCPGCLDIAARANRGHVCIARCPRYIPVPPPAAEMQSRSIWDEMLES